MNRSYWLFHNLRKGMVAVVPLLVLGCTVVLTSDRATAAPLYVVNQAPPWQHTTSRVNRPLRFVRVNNHPYLVDAAGHTFFVARDSERRIFPAYYSAPTRQYYPWYYDSGYDQYYHVVHVNNGWYRCYANSPDRYYVTTQTYTNTIPGPEYYPEIVGPTGYPYPSNGGYYYSNNISPLADAALLLPILGAAFFQVGPSYAYGAPGYAVPVGQTVYVQREYVNYAPVTIVNGGVSRTYNYYTYTPRPTPGSSPFAISRRVIAPPPAPPARYIKAAIARPIHVQGIGAPSGAGTGKPNQPKAAPHASAPRPGAPSSSGVGRPKSAHSHPMIKAPAKGHPAATGHGKPNVVAAKRPARVTVRKTASTRTVHRAARPAAPRRIYRSQRRAAFVARTQNRPARVAPVSRPPQMRQMEQGRPAMRGGGMPARPMMNRPAPQARPAPRPAAPAHPAGARPGTPPQQH